MQSSLGGALLCSVKAGVMKRQGQIMRGRKKTMCGNTLDFLK